MIDILTELIRLAETGTDCVLCTLVETRGSTPQKAGATMLVLPDGSQRGTLGGGCVEAEVKQRALRGLPNHNPELLTFHLDDNYGWDDGLICGGRMTILAQPVSARQQANSSLAYFKRFRDLAATGQGCTEALLLQETSAVGAGSRFLFDAKALASASLHSDSAPGILTQNLIPLLQRPRPYARQGVAYLPLLPRIRVLIVGGGHVGQAVGKLAADADFDVWVLDDREQYASQERFPLAQRRIVGDIGATLRELRSTEVTPSTYALIVTRGHAHDEEALYHLATTPAGYVGMIGSKRKIRLIFDDLIAKGIPRESLARVHAPLGLNIGSQTVPEIAISIVAELIAQRNLGHVPAGAREPFIITTATS